MANTAYFAAPVRGPNGDQASADEIQENIVQGIRQCKVIRNILPDWWIYCPHEHEDLYQAAWRHGNIVSDDVLSQCFDILSLTDYLFVAGDPEKSAGVRAEMRHAVKSGIPMMPLWRIPEKNWAPILETTLEPVK
ncbi:MAG: hypothetical protein GY841_16525 [FCB group bacterium]|nr:hypothetical protein [FCB group bacterium]